MIYMLIMVVLGSGNSGVGQPIRVSQYHSIEACQASAADAKSIGFDRETLGFVCVRVFGDDSAGEKRTVRLQAPPREALPSIRAGTADATGREDSGEPHDVDTTAAARQASNTVANPTIKTTATSRSPSAPNRRIRQVGHAAGEKCVRHHSGRHSGERRCKTIG